MPGPAGVEHGMCLGCSKCEVNFALSPSDEFRFGFSGEINVGRNCSCPAEMQKELATSYDLGVYGPTIVHLTRAHVIKTLTKYTACFNSSSMEKYEMDKSGWDSNSRFDHKS